jgi:hypothetical protein
MTKYFIIPFQDITMVANWLDQYNIDVGDDIMELCSSKTKFFNNIVYHFKINVTKDKMLLFILQFGFPECECSKK